jgi:hypothetical protein
VFYSQKSDWREFKSGEEITVEENLGIWWEAELYI